MKIIVVLFNEKSEILVLLPKDRTKYEFISGFIHPEDDSGEKSSSRIALTTVGLKLYKTQYIGSYRERFMTLIYAGFMLRVTHEPVIPYVYEAYRWLSMSELQMNISASELSVVQKIQQVDNQVDIEDLIKHIKSEH
jgi:hypothetical protein